MFYNSNTENLELDSNESRHCAKVLRKQVGDEIVLFNGKGTEYNCTLTHVGKICTYEINHKIEHPKPLNYINIAIAPPKRAARFDFMIEKLVEIGVNQLFLLNTANSERTRVKEERLQKQIITACKQSKQFHLPIVKENISLKELVKNEVKLFACHCYLHKERSDFKSALIISNDSSIWCIGPEGDFSQHEVEFLAEQKVHFVNLGDMRLRTETAAIYLTSNHNYFKS